MSSPCKEKGNFSAGPIPLMCVGGDSTMSSPLFSEFLLPQSLGWRGDVFTDQARAQDQFLCSCTEQLCWASAWLPPCTLSYLCWQG
jgi:hypothetical protein